MAIYKNIKGFEIQYLDSDPTNAIVGQVWYNSTTKALKGTTAGDATVGTWASGGNMNTAMGDNTGFGIQTAAITAGGTTGAGAYQNNSELYNGSSWTATPTLNTPRRAATGLGTSTAGYVITGQTTGGGVIANVEQWNGSSWTETTDVNTASRGRSSSASGTVTAAIVFAGHPTRTETESWNGSSWTEV